jgi:medium-chain acyl-[acyl-carrier-protein] hydrolase
MIGQLTQTITLRAFEADLAGGLWKPSGILIRMQEIAEDHAIALGCGRKNMVDDTGMVWMLTRLHLEMKKYPKIAQDVVIKTWHGKVERITFPRYFSFSYPNGEQLGCATSDWVLFNIRDRKLMRPSAITIPYEADETLLPPARNPMHILLPKQMEPAETRRVRYSDTDMNVHMNNSKYADWICDLFPTDKLLTQRLSELDIIYSAEAAMDQKIELKAANIDGRFYISGITQGKAVFSATGIWTD